MSEPDNRGIAPADAVARRAWPAWAKVLAYFILILIASASIWFVDRDAMRAAENAGEMTKSQIPIKSQ